MASTVDARGNWTVDGGDALSQPFALTEDGVAVDNWDDVIVQVDISSGAYGTLTLRTDDASPQVVKTGDGITDTGIVVTLTTADTSANFVGVYRIVVIDPTEGEVTTHGIVAHRQGLFTVTGNLDNITPASFSSALLVRLTDPPEDGEIPVWDALTGTWSAEAIAGVTAVSAVTATAPVTSTGGLTPDIGITPATGAAAGSMSGADKAKIDGIEVGATADQSGGEILAALLPVDGSGSGLDADLLDGQEAASFAGSGHDHSGTYDPAGSAATAQAAAVQRANHTGVQAIATVTGLQTALDDKATSAALGSHTSDTGNPHSVTKAQVGLSNVDNTSDLAKPISTDTQTALDAKAADSAVVKLTGAQTVAGVKTFSSAPAVPDGAFAQSKVVNLVADLAAKAADSAVVKLTGAQTVAGVKTFSSNPLGIEEVYSYAWNSETAALTTGQKIAVRAPFASTIVKVRVSLTTASSSGLPEFDVRKNGTTIFSTRPTINVGSKTTVGATTPSVLSTTTFADDDEITIHVITAGTGAAGAKVSLYLARTA